MQPDYIQICPPVLPLLPFSSTNSFSGLLKFWISRAEEEEGGWGISSF